MFDVCPECGAFSPEKTVVPDDLDPTGTAAFAVCPQCERAFRFLRMPLFLVSGPSGSGKTTLSETLQTILPECVVLESDILWRKEFDKPEDGYKEFYSTWLRLAKNIQQGGRPVVLCGTSLPSHLEGQLQRRFFGQLHFLALVCKDEGVLRERLARRPDWRYRDANRASFIRRMVAFNSWLMENADTTRPPMALVDTSSASREQVARQVRDWIMVQLNAPRQSAPEGTSQSRTRMTR